MSRDVGRQAVYDAEDLVFAETLYAERLGMQGVASLMAEIVAHPWWIEVAGDAPVTLRPTRREAARSHATIWRREVALALGGESCHILTHELAHLADHKHTPLGEGSHGPTFRAMYLDLAILVCGEDLATRLAASFRRSGLIIGSTEWASPPRVGPYGIYGLWRLK